MASVSYLVGNERQTAALMQTLWGTFDDKLSKILSGGKSFFLARDTQPPALLLGKVFYFCSGTLTDLIYFSRAPGITSGGLPVSYDQSFFDTYISGIDPATITWDDPNQIAVVPRVADADYGDYPVPGLDSAIGLFDWSLKACTIDHDPGTGSVPYFIRDGSDAIPEKKYRLALAEIVIEGTATSLNLPVTLDKYSCFRFHNLNGFTVTITFDSAYTFTIPPFGCQTVRRDSPTSNYRQGGHYFFTFEPGDPCFFWYIPTKVINVGGSPAVVIGTGPRAANSMAANNLSNPQLIADWVNWLGLEKNDPIDFSAIANGVLTDGSGGKHYAWFLRDRSIAADTRSINSAKFGDPSTGTTILGDLIHHKGTIKIARTAKIGGALTWDEVEFTGYADLVAELTTPGAWSAKNLTVSEDVNGDLVITNSDAANYVDLIPIGTNMFKSWGAGGEVLPIVVPLDNQGTGTSTPFTIENLLFENPPGGALDFDLHNTAPGLVFQRNLETDSNTRGYTNFDLATPGTTYTTTVTGPDLSYIVTPSPPVTRKVLHGIHRKTVNDLLLLDWWGDPTLPGGVQDTAYVTFANKALKLTPEGLLLTFDEQISSIQPKDSTEHDWYHWHVNRLDRTTVIQLRGHGWGYASPSVGSWTIAFQTPRYGRFISTYDYSAEVFGVAGADYTIAPPGAPETDWQWQQRVNSSQLALDGFTSRFWKVHGGSMLAFLQNYQTAGWYAANRGNLISDTLTTTDLLALASEPEHYNALASIVNQLTSGGALTGAALMWRAPSGSIVTLAPTAESFPVPLDCWASATSDLDLYWLFGHLGITIRTEADFPDTLSTFADEVSLQGIARFAGTISGSITAVTVVSTDGTPDGSMTASYTITIAGDSPPAATFRTGTGLGTDPHYKGDWNPVAMAEPTISTLGDFYVVSTTGPGLGGAGGWHWKGDILIQLDPTGLPSPTVVRAASNPPGSAYNPASGFWHKLQPVQGDASTALAHHSLGTWTPPTLPAAGTTAGDYWTAGSTIAGSGYYKGDRIIWDGSAWQYASYQYHDFNWVKIADVKAWLETAGFKVIFNELLIPLKLERQEATNTFQSANSLTSNTGTVTMTSVGFNKDPVTTHTALQAAQNLTFNMVGFCEWKTAANWAGSRLQWSSVTSGATWKLRQDWWALLFAGQPSIADSKNWTPVSGSDITPLLAVEDLGPLFQSNHGAIANWPDYGGWTVLPQTGANAGASISLTPQSVFGSETFPGQSAGTAYVAFSWTDCNELQKAPPFDEGNVYKWAVFAAQSANSVGLASDNSAKIVPVGSWGWDGNFWRVDDTSFKKACSDVRPSKWFAAAGSPTDVTIGAGVTYLTPPAGCAALLLADFNVNSIAL